MISLSQVDLMETLFLQVYRDAAAHVDFVTTFKPQLEGLLAFDMEM